MIRGTVYHIQRNKKEIKIEISDNTNLKKSFQWIRLWDYAGLKFNGELKKRV